MGGPGSSVGIATDYWLDVSGIESRWWRDFLPVQTGPGTHPASCTMGTGSFPGVPGRAAEHSPFLVPQSWKSRAISLPTFCATTGPVMGSLYFTFILSGLKLTSFKTKSNSQIVPKKIMKHKFSLPCLRGSTICSYSASDESNPFFFSIHILVLPFYMHLSKLLVNIY